MNILINHAVKAAGICVALAGALVACGGGGDDAAGSLTTFVIQPATVTFTAPAPASGASAACVAGGTQDVYVYGGTAPYRIDNTTPAAVSVDRTTVDSRGGHFTVTVGTASCFTGVTIVVVDKLDRQVLFTVDNVLNTGSGS